MIREDDTFSVTVRMAEIETLKEALSRSLMLRVFVGKRTATAHTACAGGLGLGQPGQLKDMARVAKAGTKFSYRLAVRNIKYWIISQGYFCCRGWGEKSVSWLTPPRVRSLWTWWRNINYLRLER